MVVGFPRQVKLVRVLDASHDEIASWDEDVMKVLPYTAADGWRSNRETVADWAARVRPLWRDGIGG